MRHRNAPFRDFPGHELAVTLRAGGTRWKTLPATIGNPAGHFEDAEFALLQHQAILAAYPRSRGWIVTDHEAPQRLSLPSQASELVRRRTRKYPLWGWKDPRSLHFLFEWKSLLPAMKTLIVWRRPEQVVTSLLRRARRARGAARRFLQISEYQAHALWLAGNLQALDYQQAHSRSTLLLGLDDFVEHGDKLPGLLKRRLQVDLDAVPVRKALKKDLLHREPVAKQPRRIADAVQRLERQATSLT